MVAAALHVQLMLADVAFKKMLRYDWLRLPSRLKKYPVGYTGRRADYCTLISPTASRDRSAGRSR